MGHTKKHIILDHLAKSKGLSRKDLVTFICKLNGYEGHKQGYYGTAIQQWEYEGYIEKRGNKWSIGNLGKLYLKHPKQATQKAQISTLKKNKAYWERECRKGRKAYWELKDAWGSEINHLTEQLSTALEQLAEVEPKRNTLTLQEPPQRLDYSEFTKGELIAIIKTIL